MTEHPTYIRALLLQGFRAYLEPKAFDLSARRCLAVFAPNGYGKSSLVDALEFAFSENGTLKRLGIRTINNSAGVFALAHNLAADRQIAASVTVDFRCGPKTASGSRSAIGAKRERPEAITAVREMFKVDPIIRGHELRRFVETETPEERYASVADWLQMGPLVEAQKNLRALRQQVKSAAEDVSAFSSIDQQLAKETGQLVLKWQPDAVIDYLNDVIVKPLDEALQFTTVSSDDAAYQAVTTRALAEGQRLGIEGLRQVRSALAALHDTVAEPVSGESQSDGLLLRMRAAVSTKSAAELTLQSERASAAEASFSALWRAAEPLFAAAEPALSDCPVCLTPIATSKAGSHEAVREHLTVHLAALKGYADAKAADDAAEKALSTAQTRLSTSLKSIALPDEYEGAAKVIEHFRNEVEAWHYDTPIAFEPVISEVVKTISDLDRRIAEILEHQGEHTYIRAKAKLDRLMDLQRDRVLALATQRETAALSDALTEQSAFIAREIRVRVQALLDGLQTPINAIYKAIQGDDAANVRLELPSEDDSNQQRLHLLIDFSENRKAVQPGGYLSDSQIHSLALALRMCAVKAFNTGAPIIALDDIVTSYDADHRRTIAALIASQFAAFQLIVTTHDEQFYRFLKDQQTGADWHFVRITKLDRDYGPRFADERVTDAMISDRWDAGESAANEMRKAEEEWLLGVCRDFGVTLRIRPLERAFSYDRGELASALASFLSNTKVIPPNVPGVNNRFLSSIQQGVVENFGSHFQDTPYADGSIGDERARWAEFVAFRDQFACPSCSRKRFKRPNDLKKPVCAHESCETQFAFK